MKSQPNNSEIVDKLQKNAIFLLEQLPVIHTILLKMNKHIAKLPVSVIMQYFCRLHDFNISTTQYAFEILANFPTEDIEEHREFIKKYSGLSKEKKQEIMDTVNRQAKEDDNGKQ